MSRAKREPSANQGGSTQQEQPIRNESTANNDRRSRACQEASGDRPTPPTESMRLMPADYLGLLQQGQEAWSQYREQCPEGTAPDLSGIQLPQADISGFALQGVALQRAYLRGASLRRALLVAANLQSAYLIDADLRGADLSEARLVAVNFNGACLAGCSFRHADLREADFGEADLSGADLTDADLHAVNLLGANLEGARFVRTRRLSSRQLMAGRNWEKAIFSPELASQLDLPRDAEHPPLADLEPEPEPRQTEARPARLRTVSCSFDPALG